MSSKMRRIPSQSRPMMPFESGPGLIGCKGSDGSPPREADASTTMAAKRRNAGGESVQSGDDAYNTSGMEKAMNAHADKLHPC